MTDVDSTEYSFEVMHKAIKNIDQRLKQVEKNVELISQKKTTSKGTKSNGNKKVSEIIFLGSDDSTEDATEVLAIIKYGKAKAQPVISFNEDQLEKLLNVFSDVEDGTKVFIEDYNNTGKIAQKDDDGDWKIIG